VDAGRPRCTCASTAISVSLYDASTLDLSAPEAEVLAAALQALFKDDDLEFVVPAPERWYVRVPGTCPSPRRWSGPSAATSSACSPMAAASTGGRS
jgi:hypothetical protein